MAAMRPCEAENRTASERRSSARTRGVCLIAGAGLFATFVWAAASSGAQTAYRFAPATGVALAFVWIVYRSRRPPGPRLRDRILGWAESHLPTWLGWVLLVGGSAPLGLAAVFWIGPGVVGLVVGNPVGLVLLTYAAIVAPLWAALVAMTVVGVHVVRDSAARSPAITESAPDGRQPT